MIKAFWYKSKNFGDLLTPVLLEHFLGDKTELANRDDEGKIVGVGSIMTAIRKDDVVWGSGCIREVEFNPPAGVKFLAVRGPETRRMLKNVPPEIYGDPGILLPRVYNPKVEKTHKIGIMPHYIDKPLFDKKEFTDDGVKFIDIEQGWKEVIGEMLSCAMIITSSLHGIIAADAYGLPVVWERYSDKIIGGDFKFYDYLLGTGRKKQSYGLIKPMSDLEKRQDLLIKVLKDHYGKN